VTKPLPLDSIYLNRQFDSEIIVLCVRWYELDLVVRGAKRLCTGRLDGMESSK
jgi:hypothetical protein